jgi:hypothetical protein
LPAAQIRETQAKRDYFLKLVDLFFVGNDPAFANELLSMSSDETIIVTVETFH